MQSRKQPAPAGATTDRPVGVASANPTAPPGGWRLSFLAGFVPVMAGLTTLLSTWIGVAGANSAWWTGLGTLDFSYSTLARAGNDAPAWVQLTGSVSRFGLRGGHRWAWWFLAFCFVWVGLHDATMATRFFAATGQPFMALPYAYCVLMLAGLLRSRRAVFARPASRAPIRTAGDPHDVRA